MNKRITTAILCSLCLFANQLYTAESKEKTSLKTYIFGQSMIKHERGKTTDHTTVPHWMYHLAKDQGYEYRVSGQYGFLDMHIKNIPPRSQWRFDDIPIIYDVRKGQKWESVDFDTMLITCGSMRSVRPPDELMRIKGEVKDYSAQSLMTELIKWTVDAEPGIQVYMYQNWRTMGGYGRENFPPPAETYKKYLEINTTQHHKWWLTLHDRMMKAFPKNNIRFVPVGSILAKILLKEPYSNIPLLDMFEDKAPHGTVNTYFVAALITYMAMYETKPPADFKIPDMIHPTIRENYGPLCDFIWAELNQLNDASGNNRVFTK